MFKPLLAYTIKDIKKINYPVFCSEKLDGIRCVIVNGKALTRSLKPIPNLYIRQILEDMAKNFPNIIFDGEIIVGKTFQETTSAVMSFDGEPEFIYNIFDNILSNCNDVPFIFRLESLNKIKTNLPPFCRVIEQKKIHNQEELENFYKEKLEEGKEGIIVRSINGIYKYGRSTEKEEIIGKLKPFIDQEFKIVGFEQYHENHNKQEKNELGYTKKSNKKEGLVPLEMLGSFICEHPLGHFNVSSGLTQEQRIQFWKERDSLIGKIIKVKYMSVGIKDLPRHPVFLGFRSEDDL